MGKVSGGTRTDKAAHWLFDVACACKLGGRNYGGRCPDCGTMLLTAYHESRLYSVYCPTCNAVTLVKSGNPYDAEAQVAVGNREGSA